MQGAPGSLVGKPRRFFVGHVTQRWWHGGMQVVCWSAAQISHHQKEDP